MDRNAGGNDKASELVNKGGVGEDDEDYIGGKDDVYLDHVRRDLVQQITPTHPSTPTPPSDPGCS